MNREFRQCLCIGLNLRLALYALADHFGSRDSLLQTVALHVLAALSAAGQYRSVNRGLGADFGLHADEGDGQLPGHGAVAVGDVLVPVRYRAILVRDGSAIGASVAINGQFCLLRDAMGGLDRAYPRFSLRTERQATMVRASSHRP